MATTPNLKPTDTANTQPHPPLRAIVNARRVDVARVDVVKKDLVLTLKSGKKVTIADGAIQASTQPDFSILFLDDEVALVRSLLQEFTQTLVSEAPWSAAFGGSLGVPLGGAALALGLAGGGGGSGGSSSSSNSGGNNSGNNNGAPGAIPSTPENSLALIQAYANDASQTVPTHQDYTLVGVNGVTTNNAGSINSVLATTSITAAQVGTAADIQGIVDAYASLMALADGQDNTLTSANPADSVYALIGVTGVDSAAKARLLGDVIDKKATTDIDTIPKIQALVEAVTAVLQGAAGGTGPSLGQLQSLGVTGVDASNLSIALQAIANTANDGSDVDTLGELQNVVNAGQATAQTSVNIIQAYALANTSPDPAAPLGIAPTLSDYSATSVTGVTLQNIDAINDALATSSVTDVQVNSISKIQALVNAYLAVLSAADGVANNATTASTLPTQTQYGLIGITGVDSASTARLLGTKLDGLNTADVDLTRKIQSLADAASAVVKAAFGVAGLTQSQVSTDLGITGITADNWPALLQAIANTADDGAGVDTLAKLQALVTTTGNALTAARSVITTYANANGGTAPALTDYSDAGVSGVDNTNLAALNSALASVSVVGTGVDTTAELQAVVNAYNALLSAADGVNNINNNQNPAQAQYGLIGVTGVNSNEKTSLLGDVIDTKNKTDIDTIAEIQNLADAVAAVMSGAAGGTAPTLSQLMALGITGVNSQNLLIAQQAVANTSDNGAAVDTLDELQTLITNALTAGNQSLSVIQTYALQNTTPAPAPTNGTPPTLNDYTNAGVTGVTVNNRTAINDALASANITNTSVPTTAAVQQLVDAYLAIFAAANSTDNLPAVNPAQAQYGYIGVTGVDNTAKTSLLGDAIDLKANADVDTIGAIQALADSVTAVMNQANGVSGLTQAQLTALGITGLTTDNLPAVLQAIANTANNGSGVDTLGELQTLVTNTGTSATAARSVIVTYADANGGTAPTVNDYADAGVTGVDNARLASINSALATASVVGTNVNSTAKLQTLVNAYNTLFALADGNNNTDNSSNPTAVTYSLIGVTQANNSNNTSLLGDAIDLKNNADIDTLSELQNLSDAVAAVMACAAGNTGPTAAQLTLLGITGVTSSNLPVALQAIANTVDTGDAVSTLSGLQAVIDAALNTGSTALTVISTYAQQNSGTAPSVSDYADAGVSVAANQLSAINSALATPNVQSTHVDTSVEVKALVEAYQAVFALADGTANQGTAVSAAQLNLLGATLGSAATTSSYLTLLNDVFDRQSSSGVDSVTKLNALITRTNAVQDHATGVVPSHTLQASDFTQIGVNGVTAGNLANVLTAIASSGATGSDSVAELQALVYGASQLSFNSISTDTGVSSTDLITNDDTLTFYGTSNAPDGSRIKLILTPTSGAPIELLTTVNAGAWEALRPTALSNGTYTVNTYWVDAGDNTTVLKTAAARTLVVDTSATLLPDGTTDTGLNNKSITIGAISPDTGNSSTDFVTNNGQIIVSGTSTAADGSRVLISINGNVAYTVVNAGAWQYNNTANTLSAGTHVVSVALTDAAGNASPSVTQNVVVNTTALTITSKTSGSIATSSDLQLVFNDNVFAQANKSIVIWNATTNAIFETISVTDTNKVTVLNKTVSINPSADFVVGNNYYALIDSDAFRSAATHFAGINNIATWTFMPVDPATDLIIAPPSVDVSNGINGGELASMHLTGTVSSPDISAVSNLTIARITFTPTDGSAAVVLTNNLPTVDPATYAWTLLNNNAWTSQLVSGKSYTVSVQLNGSIGGTATQSTVTTSIGLIDSVAPTLSITSTAANTLKMGDTAAITFTFSEAPTGFTASDVTLSNGSLINFTVTNDPKVYTATFLPNANLSGSYTPVAVPSGTYTDANGNAGGGSVGPTWTIDTTLPTISAVAISGVDSSLAAKAGTLDIGDKVKVTVTFSEAVTVTGAPTFQLNLGGVTQYAAYIQGSGTNTLVFYYTVVLGDNDLSQGITAPLDALALNGGTIVDAVGNTANVATVAIGNGTNTVVVDTNATALNTISTAAQSNNAADNLTTVAVFNKAGVVGVNVNNLSAINSALNSVDVTATQTDTMAEVQSLVSAYTTVLALADGGVSTGTAASALQYSLIGVQGIATVTTGASSVSANSKASLLSDIIDRKATTAVDTVAEVQALADMVSNVMLAANGSTAGLTLSQFTSMGITGVTSNNLSFVLQAIAGTTDTGVDVDTFAGLQLIVNNGIAAAKTAALQIISLYAANDSGTAPTLVEYANAEVTGVDANNLASINDTLTTSAVGSAAVSTTADIQSIVDAYNVVLALADGGVSAGVAVTATQLAKLGANIGNISTLVPNQSLINSILDRQARTGVDTVSEINVLASIANAIQTAITTDVAASLITDNYSLIGLTGVTGTNLNGINTSIASRALGTDLDTLSELQKLIDTYNAPLLTLSLTNDTGYNNADKITSNSNLTTGGTLLADGTLHYSVNSSTAYSTVYTPITADGTHTVYVKQIDSAGNSGQVSNLTFTYDTLAPILDLDATSGISNAVSKPPMALSLNGTQYATLGNDFTIGGSNGVALFAKIKFSGTQTNGASIIDLSTDTNGNGGNRIVMGFADNNKIYFEAFTNNVSLGRIVTSSGVSADTWHSAVVTLQTSGSTRTATLYIDGVSTQTGTFSALTTSTNYTNKYIGKSTVANSYFNGQIFDVAVIRSGTTPNSSLTTVGYPESLIVASYASLNNTTDILVATAAPSGQVSLLNNPTFVASSSASLLLSLDVRWINSFLSAVTESNRFSSIAVKVAGLYDGSNEKLVFAMGGLNSRREMDLSGASSSGTIMNFGSVPNLAWTYSNGTYTFRALAAGATLSTSNVQDFIRSLAYYNSAALATDGSRTFTITATDTAGNESAAVVSNVVVDTYTPTINTTPVMLDANNDFIKGDEFIIQFAEHVQTTPITTNSNWTFSGNAVIGNATITPIDAITVSGVEYASSYWVKRGNTSTYTVAPYAKALKLNGTSEYATLGNVTISGDITLQAWIYIDVMPVGQQYPRIIDLSRGFADKALRFLYTPSGALVLGYSDEASGATTYGDYVSDVGSITFGSWMHVAATVSNTGTVNLYKNGELLRKLSDSGDIWQNWGSVMSNMTWTRVWVGKSSYNDGFMQGSVNDVRIYDSERTVQQIRADMQGAIDANATLLRAYYTFDGTLASGTNGGTTASMNAGAATYTNGTTMSINGSAVIDTNSRAASSTQTITLAASPSPMSGTEGNNTLTGNLANNFLAGLGGNDTLTGGAGGDTFAWLSGDTGSDSVTDFKTAEGDMINLSGLLTGTGLGPNSLLSALTAHLDLTRSGDNAILKVDLAGASNFATPTKTITFTNGWLNGLDASLSNLIAQKTIILDTQRATPLVLDLNGDGVQTTTLDNGVAFDIQGHGQRVQTAWVDTADALLALDLNNDGVINNGTELFGDSTRLSTGNTAQDGFQALAQYDGNQDGVIDGLDAVFANLKLWIDANHNGVSEATELHTMAQHGVQSLQLAATSSTQMNNGNTFSLVSSWTDTSGRTHALVDVLLTNTQLKHDAVI